MLAQSKTQWLGCVVTVMIAAVGSLWGSEYHGWPVQARPELAAQAPDVSTALAAVPVRTPTSLMRLVRGGDVPSVRAALERASDRAALCKEFGAVYNDQTVLHVALSARFEDISTGRVLRPRAQGRGEGMLQALLGPLVARNPRLADAAVALLCPVRDALHYRDMSALEALVDAMSAASLRVCLLEPDYYGHTPLHVASSSKASGLARFFLQRAVYGTVFRDHHDEEPRMKVTPVRADGPLLRSLGVLEPPAPAMLAPYMPHNESSPSRATLGKAARTAAALDRNLLMGTHPAFSYRSIDAALSNVDVETVLAAGTGKAGLGISWLDTRDRAGSTALQIACQHGRVETVVSLIRARAAVGADEADAANTAGGAVGLTCGHAAAANGHASTIAAWLRERGDARVLDDAGRSPLDVAVAAGSWRCAAMLSRWLVAHVHVHAQASRESRGAPKPTRFGFAEVILDGVSATAAVTGGHSGWGPTKLLAGLVGRWRAECLPHGGGWPPRDGRRADSLAPEDINARSVLPPDKPDLLGIALPHRCQQWIANFNGPPSGSTDVDPGHSDAGTVATLQHALEGLGGTGGFGRVPGSVAALVARALVNASSAARCRDEAAVERRNESQCDATESADAVLRRAVPCLAFAPSVRVSETECAGPKCAPKGCSTEVTIAALVRDFVAVSRPVVLRGLTAGWKSRRRWTRRRLSALPLQVRTGAIPYSELYGFAGVGDVSMPLSEFVKRFMATGEPKSSRMHGSSRASWLNRTSAQLEAPVPRYVFDSQVLVRQFSADVPEHGPDALQFGVDPMLKQFAAGPALTGAPAHFHGAAWNAVVHGVKLWVIIKPGSSQAVFTNKHPAIWLLSDLSDAVAADPAGVSLALQGPGDVVVVPEHHAHVVINLADTVAVAYEYACSLLSSV